MIVINEIQCAKDAIYNRDLGKKPYETIVRVAKYYRHEGFDRNEARRKLDEFIKTCDPTASLTVWSKTLDRAIKQSEKYPLSEVNSIKIYQSEIDQIRSIVAKQTQGEADKISRSGTIQMQRIAFTLLCLAKYYSATKKDFSGWIPTPNNEIMRMANVSTSLRRQSQMLGSIRDAGLIRFSRKVDNTSIQVLFACESTEDSVMDIVDFRNLGYQYMSLTLPGFYKCEECGIMCKTSVKNKGRPPKYCEDCAVKVHVRQHVEKRMSAKKL